MINERDLVWRKASASSATGSDCVEVATLPGVGWAVRDSKNSVGPMLCFTSCEWRMFTDAVRSGKVV